MYTQTAYGTSAEALSKSLLIAAGLFQQIGLQVRRSTRAQLIDAALTIALMMLVMWTVADPMYHGYMHGHRGLLDAGAKGPGARRPSRFSSAAMASSASGLPLDAVHLESFDALSGDLVLGREMFDHHPILHASDPHSGRYHEDVVKHHPHNRAVFVASGFAVSAACFLVWRALWMRSYFRDPDSLGAGQQHDPEYKTFMAEQMTLANPPSRGAIVGWNTLATFEWAGRLIALLCLLYANLFVYWNGFTLCLLFVCAVGFVYHWSFVVRQLSRLLQQHAYLSGIVKHAVSPSDPRVKNF